MYLKNHSAADIFETDTILRDTVEMWTEVAENASKDPENRGLKLYWVLVGFGRACAHPSF